MGGFKIALNTKKPGNFAFFCPSSRLHLTISHPVAYTDRVTSSIVKAIKFGTLIDVDGTVTEYLKQQNQKVKAVNEPDSQQPEPVVEEKPKKASKKKASSKKQETPALEPEQQPEPEVPDPVQELFGDNGEQLI